MNKPQSARFRAQLEHSDLDSKGMPQTAYSVIDTRSKEFNMPYRAVSMNLSRTGAYSIAQDLNTEWQNFLLNPW